MLKNRVVLLQIAIIAGVFVFGMVVGRWMAKSYQPVSLAASGTAATSKSEAVQPVHTKLDAKALDAESVAEGHSDDAPPDSPTSSSKKSLEEILQGRNSGNRTRELEEFARNLSGSGISAALLELRRRPDGSVRDLATSLLVARWIETDSDGALQFATQNREFDYIARDVFQQLAAENVESALARAQTITDSNAREEALRGVLSYQTSQDPQAALRLAATIGPLPSGESLTQMIYRQWSVVDPKAAAAQAAQEPPGDRWNSPVGQVLRNWASQDPIAAITWTTSLPDQGTQARDISQIVRQWGRDDFNAAATWVKDVPAGPVRDAAAASLAFSISQTDPTAAVGWVQSIGDVSQRDNALQRLSREIMYRNPTNGAAILLAAGVPQNQIPQPPSQNRGRGRGPR
jgi:hypothetical protein